jgi:3-deoxy-manno-octulosonate cytidylyltransferase (CMP-KDO synthetase)
MEADVTCVVPARLGSTRFPRKLLRTLLDKPVVVHSLERAAQAGCFSEVLCFTDSIEIGEAVSEYGFRFVLTGEAANGTERIARNLDEIKTECVVNLQGDEPAFPAEGLLRLCRGLQQNPEWVHTLVHAEAPAAKDLNNPNRVKAILSADGFILDFQRSPGDLSTASAAQPLCRLHLGAYGYSKKFLRSYAAAAASKPEIEMSHELLRDLSLAPVRAHVSPPGSPVDVPADLAFALERLESLRMPQGVMP